MEKNVQIDADETITKLLADNASSKAHIKTLYSIILLILSKTYGISHEKAKEIVGKILKDRVSLEKIQMLIDLDAFDDEIQNILEDD